MPRYIDANGALNKLRYIARAYFIELPCKVGDTIWYIGRRRIDDVQTESIHCWVGGHWKISCRRGLGRFYVGYEFSFGDFGKTVFLTREAAEQALKEAKKDV